MTIRIIALSVWFALASHACADPPAKLALNGLDPVALIDGKEIQGSDTIDAVHGPFRYRFASEENKKMFMAKPEEFGIQFGGACGKMGPFSGDGNPGRFFVHERRIYVFASEGCRDAFKRDPDKHIDTPNPAPTGSAEQAARGKALIEKALTGFGGAARVDAVKSWQLVNKNIYKGASGDTTSFQQWTWSFPGRVRIEETFSTAYGFAIDRDKAMQFAGAVTTPLDSAMRDIGWRQALREPFAMLRHRNEPGFVAIAQKDSVIDGQTVNQVKVALDGATSTWSLDEKTGRVVQAAYRARRATVGDVVVKFGDFRDVDGLILPHQRSVTFNGKPVTSPEAKHERFIINAEIKPERFTHAK